MKSELIAELQYYQHKIWDELYLGLSKKCYDHVKDQKEETGVMPNPVQYKVHNVLDNRARRRWDKRPHFSNMA